MWLGKACKTILLTAALALPAFPGVGAVSPPAAVLALVTTDATLVYWAPSDTVAADISYNVYGIRNGAETLIENTRLTASVVLDVYESYAVSTVVNGQESALKYTVGGVCIRPQDDPPTVTVSNTPCTTGVYGGVGIPRP